jgi:hypothetical protein
VVWRERYVIVGTLAFTAIGAAISEFCFNETYSFVHGCGVGLFFLAGVASKRLL